MFQPVWHLRTVQKLTPPDHAVPRGRGEGGVLAVGEKLTSIPGLLSLVLRKSVGGQSLPYNDPEPHIERVGLAEGDEGGGPPGWTVLLRRDQEIPWLRTSPAPALG